MHYQSLPSKFQHFNDPRVGGVNPFIGYCPVWTPYSTGGDSSFCKDSQQSSATKARGESFGASSRCVMSTVVSRKYRGADEEGTCRQTRCYDTGVDVRVGNEWIFCSSDSEGKQLSA